MNPSRLSGGLRSSTSHPLPGQSFRAPLQRRPALAVQDCADTASANPLVVRIPPPRQLLAMPSPVAVIHSPGYIYEMRTLELLGQSSADVAREPSFKRPVTPDREEFEGSTLEWALARADDTLYEMEKNPNKLTQLLWQASRSPVGEAAAAGVRGAADLTLAAGTKFVKVAGPVGVWVVQEGVKAAFGFISELGSENGRKKRLQRQLEQHEALEDGVNQGQPYQQQGQVVDKQH